MINSAWNNIQKHVEQSTLNYFQNYPLTQESQEHILITILKYNASSKFGRLKGFNNIQSYEDFVNKVSPTSYDEMKSDPKYYFCGQIIAIEETSGSSGIKKCIAYNEKSLRSFINYTNIVLDDLINAFPEITKGKLFLPVSPKNEDDNSSEIPSAEIFYFDKAIQKELSSLLVIPFNLREVTEIKSWLYLCAYFALLEKNISIISLWSPSFLLELHDFIIKNKGLLINSIRTGQLPYQISQNYPFINQYVYQSKSRADYLDNIEFNQLKNIWPILSVISCWKDASSSVFYQKLETISKGINLVAKGILATEAPISIKLCQDKYAYLYSQNVFYEFLDINGKYVLLNELGINQEYSIYITTYNGLYRYNLGDSIKVVDIVNGIPQVIFIGRGALTSDICGEKLSESFIVPILNELNRFSLISQNIQGNGYILWLENECVNANKMIKVNERLCQNYHYKFALHAGQIKPISQIAVKSLSQHYQKYLKQNTSLFAHHKPVLLLKDGKSWYEYLNQNRAIQAI